MKVPRKLLVVKRDPPDKGYNVMLEIDGMRTRSVQVDEETGERIMSACQDQIVSALANTVKPRIGNCDS